MTSQCSRGGAQRGAGVTLATLAYDAVPEAPMSIVLALSKGRLYLPISTRTEA